MSHELLLTPELEITNRIHILKQYMENQNMSAVLLTHKPDIFYFSGTAQDSYLYIHMDHDPVLFVKRYLTRAKHESCLTKIFQISSITQIPKKIKTLHSGLPKNCGLTFDVVPVRDFHYYQNLFDPVPFLDCSTVISSCRRIKSVWEIKQMKKAALLSKKTFAYIQENLRPGISEMEFCGEYETFARRLGHSGILRTRHYRSVVFPFHLLSGKSGGLAGAVDTPCCGLGTSVAHPFGASAKRIQKNEPILIDVGTILHGYHMDETRMFAIGTMPKKAGDASKAAKEILFDLIYHMKPGAILSELYDSSIQLAKQLGYEEQFLGLPDLKSLFVGHGIGLELVESPLISKGKLDCLEPGMVLAVEPKFIFKNKFAAGIESVIQITKNGACLLSSTPHDFFICK